MDNMKRLAHFEVHEVALDVEGPLHIGTGQMATPMDFVAFPEGVRLVQQEVLETAIAERHLLTAWAAYLAEKPSNIAPFIERHHLQNVLGPLLPFARPAESISAVHPFLRRPNGEAYLPGSTIKGAIATALMTWQLNEMPREDRVILAAEVRQRLEEAAAGQAWSYLSDLLLKILPINYQDTNNPVNSMMRVYSFDDSDPIADSDLFLAPRDDESLTGPAHLTDWRESVRPGVTVRTRLTIDTVMMARTRSMLTVLSEALENWQRLQERVYHDKIDVANLSPVDRRERYIYLGGGAGIVSKILLYALFDEKEARAILQQLLDDRHESYHPERGTTVAPYMRHISRLGKEARDIGKVRITIHY